MKIALFILLLFSSDISFAQKKRNIKQPALRECGGVTMLKSFTLNDTTVVCNTCNWDMCGNLKNNNGDTILKNSGPTPSQRNTLYVVSNNILVSKNFAVSLFNKNKVAAMQFYHCNEIPVKFNFVSLGGVNHLTVKDTLIETISLLKAVQNSFPNKSIIAEQILIYGIELDAIKLRYPINETPNVAFVEKTNRYSIYEK